MPTVAPAEAPPRHRHFLIVARSKEDARAVERRLVHEPRRVRWAITGTHDRPPAGCSVDEIVWVDGWRRGAQAAAIERWVRAVVAAKRDHVDECEVTASPCPGTSEEVGAGGAGGGLTTCTP